MIWNLLIYSARRRNRRIARNSDCGSLSFQVRRMKCGLTGRSRLALPDLSQPTSKSKSTKLPRFLQKHTIFPTVPPVEVEFDRLAQHAKSDKLGRIIDCVGTLADKCSNSTEESTMSLLTELAVFALRWFGTFSTHLGTGVYGPELESTLKRQALSSKPMTWATGIRAPFNNWIARGTAALSRGCPSAKHADGVCLLLGHFPLWAGGNFSEYRPTGIKSEARPKEPLTVNMFGKWATVQPRYFSAVYGEEHLKPRVKAIRALVNTSEVHPKVPPIDFIGDVRNRTNYDFVDACLAGIRRNIRIARQDLNATRLHDYRGDHVRMAHHFGSVLIHLPLSLLMVFGSRSLSRS